MSTSHYFSGQVIAERSKLDTTPRVWKPREVIEGRVPGFSPHWRFGIEVLNAALEHVSDLTLFKDARVEYSCDGTEDVQATLAFTLDASEAFGWVGTRLRPRAWLAMPDGTEHEWLLGTYVPASPSLREEKGHETVQVQAFGLNYVLRQSGLPRRLLIPATVPVVSVIADVLDLNEPEGSGTHDLPPGLDQARLSWSTKGLNADMEFAPGTPYLTVVNTLLEAISFERLWMDRDGSLVAGPETNATNRQLLTEYGTGQWSVTAPRLERAVEATDIPDQVVRTYDDAQGDGEPQHFTGVANLPDAHPLSRANRGYSVRDVAAAPSGTGTQNENSLNALALRDLERQASDYERLTFSTALNPDHWHRQAIDFAYAPRGLAKARYEEVRWTLPMDAGGLMEHEVRAPVVGVIHYEQET